MRDVQVKRVGVVRRELGDAVVQACALDRIDQLHAFAAVWPDNAANELRCFAGKDHGHERTTPKRGNRRELFENGVLGCVVAAHVVREHEREAWRRQVDDRIQHRRANLPDTRPDALRERRDAVRIDDVEDHIGDAVVVYQPRPGPPRKLGANGVLTNPGLTDQVKDRRRLRHQWFLRFRPGFRWNGWYRIVSREPRIVNPRLRASRLGLRIGKIGSLDLDVMRQAADIEGR